jgi:hypothetical protein
MEAINETALADRELQKARSDLRETLEEVNHKVEAVEARLQPRAILRRNPLPLALLAGAAGFLASSDRQLRALRWLVIGGLLGGVLAIATESSENGSDTANE